jgi:hypothetical protein
LCLQHEKCSISAGLTIVGIGIASTIYAYLINREFAFFILIAILGVALSIYGLISFYAYEEAEDSGVSYKSLILDAYIPVTTGRTILIKVEKPLGDGTLLINTYSDNWDIYQKGYNIIIKFFKGKYIIEKVVDNLCAE